VIRVLVVDDDFRVARIHSAFVDRVDGFRTVGVAHTGADALSAARELAPDLILLDLYLPDIFGLDLISRIRVEGATSDVIVISAANESETVERAVKLGVASYLLKPFTMIDLTARLEEYQAQHRNRSARTLGDQAEVDRMFGRAQHTAPLPKGMSPETAELILGMLSEQAEELSAQECADAVGMSRVSARRYLEHFVDKGRVQVSLRYGSRGRPERRYSLAPKDASAERGGA
jgi:response regulator of citrate/malate metabolism